MSKTTLCKRDAVPVNGMKGCETDDGTLVLLADTDGELFAWQGLCPHQEVCLADGLYDGKILTCHQHLWQWDVRTGDPIGMAEEPLAGYRVSVQDGEVVVEMDSLSIGGKAGVK